VDSSEPEYQLNNNWKSQLMSYRAHSFPIPKTESLVVLKDLADNGKKHTQVYDVWQVSSYSPNYTNRYKTTTVEYNPKAGKFHFTFSAELISAA
jgi:hypothetical protein